MTEEPSRFTLSPTARRLIRSYGLLILIAIGFLLMAMMIREKPKTVPAESIQLHLRSEEVRTWL
jgi:hypothetical protein